ncbi:MAG TPA: hypothetical protein VHO43_13380 [Ignavibacteriales bacterium]|nr:hypothetical protein [Ignavibacteriales bacterium]
MSQLNVLIETNIFPPPCQCLKKEKAAFGLRLLRQGFFFSFFPEKTGIFALSLIVAGMRRKISTLVKHGAVLLKPGTSRIFLRIQSNCLFLDIFQINKGR